eukprot:GEZU01020804.1.p1 GENE.GEZU01020804.1~~GEZU01020804.1.p1  ORF type:complete len:181 (+),score=50.32 GEZU01020804.1:78-620(+)
MSSDPRLENIKSLIRTVPDFPKPGIQFKDITTLLKDPTGFKQCIDIFVERYRDQKVDVIVGIESRGFILGAAIAYALGVGFVPLRKPGKLPGKTESLEYILEYGSDKLEIHTDAIAQGSRCVIVDDLIATGGTLECGCKLVEKVGGVVVEAALIAELPELKGRSRITCPLYVLVQYPNIH